MKAFCWLMHRLRSLPQFLSLDSTPTSRFFQGARLFRRQRFPDGPRLRLVLEALEERWVPSVVTSTSDLLSDTGSLRYAVTNAVVGETISFDSTLSGQTITLASTLTLSSNLTIQGPSGGITLDGRPAGPHSHGQVRH